jgi:hypothetical protein
MSAYPGADEPFRAVLLVVFALSANLFWDALFHLAMTPSQRL